MKKIIVLVALLLVFCSSSLMAAESYYVKDGGFTVTNPEDHYVLYKGLPDDSDVLSFFEVSSADVDALLDSMEILWLVMENEDNYEIFIRVMEDDFSSDIFTLNQFGDDELIEFYQIVLTELVGNVSVDDIEEHMGIESGVESIEYGDTLELIAHPQCKFFQYDAVNEVDGVSVDVVSNYSVVNGKNIYLTLSVYDLAYMEQGLAVLEEVRNSIQFDEILEAPDPEKSREAFDELMNDAEESAEPFYKKINWLRIALTLVVGSLVGIFAKKFRRK